MSEHVLVVDDDPKIRSFIRNYLGENGYRVSEARDGTGMRHTLANKDIDLIILDLVLPGGEDGLELARQIRTQSEVPIIMVTGRGDPVDRVVGLELGADDYLPKPFQARELLARVRSVLRRTKRTGDEEEKVAPPPKLVKFSGWALDKARHRLLPSTGKEVRLTSAEFGLLSAFLDNPDKILSRDQLFDLVYGREMVPFERSIDVLVMRLRKKIEENPGDPLLIQTIRGEGYAFTPEVSAIAPSTDDRPLVAGTGAGFDEDDAET